MDASTILKFAGILVSGVLGVLGTVTKTRNDQDKSLTIWGRCALWLTIAGAGLALGAQLFDSINQKKDEREILGRLEAQSTKLQSQTTILEDQSARLATQSTQNGKILSGIQAQSTTATESLTTIRDVISKFGEIQIRAEFERPQTDPRVAALAAEFHRWASSGFADTGSNFASTNCLGFDLGTHNGTVICSPFNPNLPALNTALPSLAKLSNLWEALPLEPGRVWINKKRQPVETLVNRSIGPSDLGMFNCNYGENRQGGIIYYESNRKIYIATTLFHAKTEIPDCWFRNAPIIGLADVAGSQLVVEFNWTRAPKSSGPDPLLYKIRPDFIRFSAGDRDIYLRRPATVVQEPKDLYRVHWVLSEFSEAPIPDVDDIFDGRASILPARRADFPEVLK